MINLLKGPEVKIDRELEHLLREESVFIPRTEQFRYFIPAFSSGINQKYFHLNENVITFSSLQLLI